MLRVKGKLFYGISLCGFVCSSADHLTNTWALCSHPHLKRLQLMEASQSPHAKPALESLLPPLPLSSDFNGKSFFSFIHQKQLLSIRCDSFASDFLCFSIVPTTSQQRCLKKYLLARYGSMGFYSCLSFGNLDMTRLPKTQGNGMIRFRYCFQGHGWHHRTSTCALYCSLTRKDTLLPLYTSII